MFVPKLTMLWTAGAWGAGGNANYPGEDSDSDYSEIERERERERESQRAEKHSGRRDRLLHSILLPVVSSSPNDSLNIGIIRRRCRRPPFVLASSIGVARKIP